jgi:hypothetical protein
LGIRVAPFPINGVGLIARVHRYQPAERMAPNTLFLDVIDQTGQRQRGSYLWVKDVGGKHFRVPIEKPDNEPGGNFPMWPGHTYEVVGVRLSGNDQRIQPVTNLRSEYPDGTAGVSLLVVVQLGKPTAKPAATPATTQPEPTPAAKPAPQPGLSVQNDVAALGVRVSSVPMGAGSVVKRIHRYGPDEHMGPNTLYLDLVNAAGQRQFGADILVRDATGRTFPIRIEKPASEPGANIPMWPGNVYDIVGVVINGQQKPAQQVTNLRSAYPGDVAGLALLVEMQVV